MFGKDERWYERDGKKYPSVTSVENIISKPALYKWYENLGAGKAIVVLNLVKEFSETIHEKILKRLPKGFDKSGQDTLKEAAQHGTKAHSAIEHILKGIPYDESDQTPESKNAIGLFLKWRDQVKFKPIKAEFKLFSERYRFAGTCDCIAEVDGKVTLVDWKTSKGIYAEHLYQVCAYAFGVEEYVGDKIEAIKICRFGKYDADFEIKDIPKDDWEMHFKTFLSAYELWRRHNQAYLAKKGFEFDDTPLLEIFAKSKRVVIPIKAAV